MRFSISFLIILFFFSCSVDSVDGVIPSSKIDKINKESYDNSFNRIPTYFTGKQHELSNSVCGIFPYLTIPVYYFNFQATPNESCTSLYIWWDMGDLMPYYNSGNYDIEIVYKYRFVSNNQLVTGAIDVDAVFDLYANPNPFLLKYFEPGATVKGIKALVYLTNRTTNCQDQFTPIKWTSPCD